MKLSFEISYIPADTSQYRLAAFTEGRLVVSADEALLELEDVLLVELAVALRRWTRGPEASNFYYSSMNFEEEPVVAFTLDDTHRYEVWSALHASRGFAAVDEVTSAVDGYLDDLVVTLRERFSIAVDLDALVDGDGEL